MWRERGWDAPSSLLEVECLNDRGRGFSTLMMDGRETWGKVYDLREGMGEHLHSQETSTDPTQLKSIEHKGTAISDVD